MNKGMKIIEWILRIGVFGCFLGHGFVALSIKKSWIPLLTVYGFSEETAITLLPLIGMLDIVVAFVVLFRPTRMILIWAIFWTFATALTRFISGEPIWEFIERAANWTTPLALFVLRKYQEEKVTGSIFKNYTWFIPALKKEWIKL